MNHIEREYEYRASWTLIVVFIVMFSFGALLLGRAAARNDRGLIIQRIIELGPTGATIFYWCLCAFSGALALFGVFMAHQRLTKRRRVAFTATTIIVPVSRWSTNEQEIGYREISWLSTERGTGHNTLHFTHGGSTYKIDRDLLPSNAAFEEVCELLATKVQLAKEQGGPRVPDGS